MRKKLVLNLPKRAQARFDVKIKIKMLPRNIHFNFEIVRSQILIYLKNNYFQHGKNNYSTGNRVLSFKSTNSSKVIFYYLKIK